ncbi:hypothetical protein Tco_0618349 [Tanacetum coccineum]
MKFPEAFNAHIYPTLEAHFHTSRNGTIPGKVVVVQNCIYCGDRLDMKVMQDNVKAGLIPFKTDQEILDEIVPSDNRQNMSGMGRSYQGGGSTSRRRANRAFGDVIDSDQITRCSGNRWQEKELL